MKNSLKAIDPVETVSNSGSARAPAQTLGDLAPEIAGRAAGHDKTDQFVADNYALLRNAGLFEAGVPVELGGGGASVSELCEMLRLLGRSCGSTALAFAMHTHQVAVPAWRWRHQPDVRAKVEPLLRRISAEQLVLLSSGGSDWIEGSGEAQRVDGGYRITARKVFTSGAPAGDLLMTGAVCENPDGSRSVVHFGLPMKAPEVSLIDTWQVLGMRGTGSQDVRIEGFFVPDSAVALIRPAGEWHPLFQIIATVAFPLIYSAYLGIAENARDTAVAIARKKKPDQFALALAGRMDTALAAARMAHRAMVDTAESGTASAETVNDVMIGRSLVGQNAIRTVELAMELAGGSGFYRKTGLERCFRDIQAARYHPMQSGHQELYAGSMALGEPITKVF